MALTNQHHPNDLLLIDINGFYTSNTFDMGNGRRSSNYAIGPGAEGHSESLHYGFIHAYRTNYIADKLHSEYLKDHEYSPEKSQIIDELTEAEGLTIQMEMLVFLKIWEMSQYLKNLYEFVRILNGEHYEWHFKLRAGDDNTGIATAQELIRVHIRDEIRQYSEPIYTTFRTAYKSQIRNSIAHSNYSFMGRNIHPNNHRTNVNYLQITNLPFDEWIDMFHSTLILHNAYLILKNRIHSYYRELALSSNNRLEIRINKQDGTEELGHVEYRTNIDDWRWVQ